jgi:hypothetical protein
MKFFLILCLSTLMFSCQSYIDEISNNLDVISLEEAEKYNVDYKFNGGHYENDGVSSIGILFYKNEKLGTNEARKLFLVLHKDILLKIKKDILINKYINGEALKKNDLEISLSFKNKKGEFFNAPYVATARNEENEVIFSFIDEKTGKTTRYKETLEEAYRIVEEEERLSL